MTGYAVAPADWVSGSIEDGLLESILSVLATTYDEQEVRERLSPTFVHSLHALQSARTAGWLTTYEFEEELLRLFTHGAAAAAPTTTTPSSADRTSGDLGAQVATATARGTGFLCDPSLISPRGVLGTQVPTPCFPRSPEMQLGARDAPIPNGLVSSGLGLEAPSQTAEHDTGSLKSHASRLTDQPSDNGDTSGCCPLA